MASHLQILTILPSINQSSLNLGSFKFFMIESLAKAMSPWTYSPLPVVRIAARATFVFLIVVVPVAAGLSGIYIFSAALLRGVNYLIALIFKRSLKGLELPPEIKFPLSNSMTLYCSEDQFQEKQLRAKDLKVTFGILYETESCLPEGFNQPEIFVSISHYLPFADYQSLSRVSKRSFVICKEQREFVYKRFFAQALKFSISETLFPRTYSVDQYTLYFHICKQLCGHPQRPSPDFYMPLVHKGSNLIRYFIEQIGPFTFLSIPHMHDFKADPVFPIERTSKTSTTFDELASSDGVHTMKIRFKMKIDDKIIHQEISQRGTSWFASSLGILPQGIQIDREHIDFLIALIKNPEGANLSMFVKDCLFEVKTRHRRPDDVIQIHAKLDPPLHSLKE